MHQVHLQLTNQLYDQAKRRATDAGFKSVDEYLAGVVSDDLTEHAELKSRKSKLRVRGLSGVPMSDDEAAIVDEALAIAMEGRRERSTRVIGA